jgi:hypothetical protein
MKTLREEADSKMKGGRGGGANSNISSLGLFSLF